MVEAEVPSNTWKRSSYEHDCIHQCFLLLLLKKQADKQTNKKLEEFAKSCKFNCPWNLEIRWYADFKIPVGMFENPKQGRSRWEEEQQERVGKIRSSESNEWNHKKENSGRSINMQVLMVGQYKSYISCLQQWMSCDRTRKAGGRSYDGPRNGNPVSHRRAIFTVSILVLWQWRNKPFAVKPGLPSFVSAYRTCLLTAGSWKTKFSMINSKKIYCE